MGATDRKTNSDETPLHSLESQKHQYKNMGYSAGEHMVTIENLNPVFIVLIKLPIHG